jgi:hypothetical protein
MGPEIAQRSVLIRVVAGLALGCAALAAEMSKQLAGVVEEANVHIE